MLQLSWTENGYYLCIVDGSFGFFPLTPTTQLGSTGVWTLQHIIAINSNGSSKHMLRSFYTEIDYDLFILYILYILTFIIIIIISLFFVCLQCCTEYYTMIKEIKNDIMASLKHGVCFSKCNKTVRMEIVK